MNAEKHTLMAIVEDEPGILNRVSSMFRRRNFNIESIAVGYSETPHLSRMTIVVDGATTAVEQVRKQLEKLIDVIKVSDITKESYVARELALIKVKTNRSTRGEIMQIAHAFRANIVDVSIDSVIVEVTGDEDKISSLYELLRPFGVKEMSRTGVAALSRSVRAAFRDIEEKESARRYRARASKK